LRPAATADAAGCAPSGRRDDRGIARVRVERRVLAKGLARPGAHVDAAALQQDYEGLLGRPAQSISLSTDAGATRWSATWVDANLPMASHAMTVEALIVPLSNAWVLELSLSGVETREAYDALAARLLARLRVQGRASCQG